MRLPRRARVGTPAPHPARAASARRTAGLAAGAVLLTALSACTGGGGSGAAGDDDATPEEVLAQAKEQLDSTPGVHVVLTSDGLPEGETGLVGADVVGTHEPSLALEGTITVRLSGIEPVVPIVAVDGETYAQLPLTSDYQVVDPSEYGAPADPAQLLSTDAGFSSLLTQTTDVEAGDQVRGGEDNTEVLTEYTGTVPGTAAANILPTAEGDFDVAYTVTDDGELRQMVVTGAFYGGDDQVTYTVDFDQYGIEQEITAP